MKTIYIHTLNGKPAMFDGYQVCFSNHYGPGSKPAYSLKQIRKEQRERSRHRAENGWDDMEYGYVRYRISDDQRG